MSVSAFCPNCGNRFSLWANPGETLLLKALNAGLAGGELMTQVLESAGATLPHAIDQAPLPPVCAACGLDGPGRPLGVGRAGELRHGLA